MPSIIWRPLPATTCYLYNHVVLHGRGIYLVGSHWLRQGHFSGRHRDNNSKLNINTHQYQNTSHLPVALHWAWAEKAGPKKVVCTLPQQALPQSRMTISLLLPCHRWPQVFANNILCQGTWHLKLRASQPWRASLCAQRRTASEIPLTMYCDLSGCVCIERASIVVATSINRMHAFYLA